MTTRTTKLLKLRRDQLELFQRAAERLGASASEFIVESATLRARHLLNEWPEFEPQKKSK